MGITKSPNGASSRGYFFQNKLHDNKGEILFANKGKYVGGVKMGKMHGRGVYRSPAGIIYEGEFNEDAQHGHGKITYPRGGWYEGAMVNGEKHGTGTNVEPNGVKYEGHWEKGYKQGVGKITFPNEAFYIGDFHSGRIHGTGIFTEKSFRIHRATWKPKRKGDLVVGTKVDGTTVVFNSETGEFVSETTEPVVEKVEE